MKLSPDAATESLISQVISTWRGGQQPDALDFLSRHPGLRDQKSLVLNLAYEEYCLRKEAGEPLALSSYCERFPTCRRSLRRLIAVHECFDEDADLARTADDVEWPKVGTQFWGFQLVRELGRGAFAHVYLATQPALGHRPVVVKIAQHGSGEAETLGRLAHRNIVPVHSVTEDPQTHMTAVCMPYLGSATLMSVLDVGYANGAAPEDGAMIQKIAFEEAILDAVPEMYTIPNNNLQRGTFVDAIVHLMAQLADALAHAHQAGICHRDLKPTNILLTPSGCPMLLDFNLSSNTALLTTLIGGTLPYMPPEQLGSMMIDVADASLAGDPQSDIFALGVILYECLTGELPFGDRPADVPADTAATLMLERQEAGYEPVHRRNRRVNRGLAAVVDQCLKLAQEQRPRSAEEVAAMLRAQLTGTARLTRWAERRRFLVGASGLGLALFGGVAGTVIASRAPYPVRRYEAGIRAFQQQDYPQSIECFTEVCNARPAAYQPLFARGQALVALGQSVPAIADFRQVYELAPSGFAAEWLGYALAREGHLVSAALYYQKAIEEHLYETAAVYNNLGFGLRQDMKFRSDARDYLTRAIQLDPECQTAYHNRSAVYSQYGKKVAPTGAPYGQLAIEDIERAIEIGPASGELLFDAALMYLQHNDTRGGRQRCIEYLCRAIELGYDRNKILRGSGLDPSITDHVAGYRSNAKTVASRPLVIPPENRFPPFTAE